jgi:Transglycosylase SLT domain
MAEEDYSGLAKAQQGLATVPTYGATDEQYQSLKQAQEQALTALQQRYQDPNWFNVAAGFLKPQLGGFAASLGSGLGELGKNLDLQRQQQLPIAQMRSQLAQTNLLLSQNKAVSDMLAKRKADGLPITPDFVSEVVARAPDSPVAKALSAQIGTQQKQQEITSNIQANAIKAIELARNKGIKVPDDLYTQAGLAPPGKVEQPQGGFSPKVGEPASPAPAAPAAASAPASGSFDTTKSYGTPTKLLDNLAGVESSNDPYAVNKESKAAGKYQFTPETAAMLNKQGIKFNPFDEKESRAAADFYLQKLLKDNGGDWNKTLAAYGGFQKKDPTDYINKVTKGVDLSQPALAPEQAAAAKGTQYLPTHIVKAPADMQENPLYTMADKAELLKGSDEKLNAIANNRYAALESVANPSNYKESQGDYESFIKLLKSDPSRAARVVNPLAQRGGLIGGMLNGAEAGLGFNINGLSGNIQVPISKAIVGSYSPDDKAFYDALNSAAAKIAVHQQSMANVNPGTIRNGEISLYKSASIDPATQFPNVMIYNARASMLNNDMLHEMYTKANNILKEQDPNWQLNPDSRTKLHDILTGPAMDEIANAYEKKRQNLNDEFLAYGLKKNKKP